MHACRRQACWLALDRGSLLSGAETDIQIDHHDASGQVFDVEMGQALQENSHSTNVC